MINLISQEFVFMFLMFSLSLFVIFLRHIITIYYYWRAGDNDGKNTLLVLSKLINGVRKKFMSNLFKSKFLLGVMVVAAMFVGVVAVNATSASAASCTITTTLRVGSKGAQVQCLQAALGLTADGSFGPKTKAAVVSFQTAHGLTADGVFGPMSRAAWQGASAGTLPAGCTSTAGFSPTTGASCATGMTTVSTLPAGCTSTAGFSPTTGVSCATGVGSVVTSGPISAMLSTDNPASGYIIDNQATADLAHFTFTGTGTVTSVTLTRTGISNQNTLDNVYLFQGNTRITDGYSFNNSGTLVINSLAIAVNGSTTISVKADVDAAAASTASTLGVSLSGYTAGTTPVVSNLMGNQMYLGTGSPAGVVVGSTNNVSASSVNAGTSSYTVWSSPIQINTRAVWLKGANFRITGSAPSNALANVHLFVDGVDSGVVATMTSITGSNYATFDFSANPINLTTGSHTIDVRADVVAGAGYNVTVSLQQAADLVVYDPQVGVNVAATHDGTNAFSANSAGLLTINQGSAAVVVDPTFQSQTNVTGGATNIDIGKFQVTGYGEDVKVTSLEVTPSVTNACTTGATYGGTGCADTTTGSGQTEWASGNGLNNVTLYFNGSQVGSSVTWKTGDIVFNLGSQMIIPAGSISTIEVRADLQTASTATYVANTNYTAGTVSTTLNMGTTNGQGQTSHNNVAFPGSDITGTSLTIQTGLLAVSKNTGYASQSVNPNTAGVEIGSYTLQNQSSSESVRVTSLAVGLTQTNGSTALTGTAGGGYPALTNFSNLRTSETSGSGSTPIQPTAANTFSVNFTLAPGATDVINIFADTSSDASDAFSTNLKVTSIGASSNVSISQNGTGTAVAGQVISLAAGTVTNPPTLLTSTSTASQYVAAANGGASNVAKATFNIQATGGSATISELKFTVNSQDASTAASAGTLTAGNQTMTNTASTGFAVGDFVKITASTTNAYGYVVSGQTGTSMVIDITSAGSGTPSLISLIPNTVTAVTVNGTSAPVVAGIAYLTGLNLSVPNGSGGLNQDVYVSYAPVGTNGIISGATSRIALESIKYSSGGTTTTMCTAAIATCSGHVISTAIAAPTMTLVGSSPTFTATKPSSTLSASNVEAIDVTVTANAKGNVQLNTLELNYSANGACVGGRTASDCNTGNSSGSTTNVIVDDANNQLITTSNTAFVDSAAAAKSGSVTITFGSGYTISGSQTFKIFLPVSSVTGTGVNGASLTTSLATGSAALTWTDLAGSATVAQGAFTTNALPTVDDPTALIASYPSTYSSLIYN